MCIVVVPQQKVNREPKNGNVNVQNNKMGLKKKKKKKEEKKMRRNRTVKTSAF